MQSPYSVLLYGALQPTPMFPTHPLRKRRAFLFFHSIQFILSTLGNPMKKAQFLKTLPTPTLIAHIKKSDIRGNLGAISLKKQKQKQDETLSSFRKYWFYILLFFSHLLVHIPMLTFSATHLGLRGNYSYLNKPPLPCGLAYPLSLFLAMRP